MLYQTFRNTFFAILGASAIALSGCGNNTTAPTEAPKTETSLPPASTPGAYKINFRVEPNPPAGAKENAMHVTVEDSAGKPVSDAQVRINEFLDSDDGRPVRILSEYLGPLRAFRQQGVRDTIVFFGSARLREDGPLGRFYSEARELARLVAEWSNAISDDGRRFIVCSGGGEGIMEASNRGAADAGERTIGLNIGLPLEQRPNSYITPELRFEFHYFFMRKLWFAHLARALVIFPGGFGTLDELFEILTLVQTHKLDRRILVLLYSSTYWKEILNFDALVRHGMIAPEDLSLFQYADDPDAALRLLKQGLPIEPEPAAPAFAKSMTSCSPGAACLQENAPDPCGPEDVRT